MTGYVVIFEGDDEEGYSAYSPDVPGVVAAAATRPETDRLIREAIAEHVDLLRELRQPVPEFSDSDNVAVVSPFASA